MTIGPAAQWIAFTAFALISVAGALGMATTMSMFRSGIFLMASFIGVAGLFILLLADLLALLQVMMYIGGMLVMILFMVLFSGDPGGAMMAGMKMDPVSRFFSLGIRPQGMEHGGGNEDRGSGGQHEGDGDDGEGAQGGMDMDMDMAEMSMTTAIKRPAAILALVTGGVLVALLLLRPAWPVTDRLPDPQSARLVGSLLMSKYMMAFEGAGLLILIGIFGAVLLGRPDTYPDKGERGAPVAVDADPAPLQPDRPSPLHDLSGALEPIDSPGAHRDEGG